MSTTNADGHAASTDDYEIAATTTDHANHESASPSDGAIVTDLAPGSNATNDDALSDGSNSDAASLLDVEDVAWLKAQASDGTVFNWLQGHLQKPAARKPAITHVKAAYDLYTEEKADPLFKPDFEWWKKHSVPDGGARTRVREYKARVAELLVLYSTQLTDDAKFCEFEDNRDGSWLHEDQQRDKARIRDYFTRGGTYLFDITLISPMQFVSAAEARPGKAVRKDPDQYDYYPSLSNSTRDHFDSMIEQGLVKMRVSHVGLKYVYVAVVDNDGSPGLVPIKFRFELELAYTMVVASHYAPERPPSSESTPSVLDHKRKGKKQHALCLVSDLKKRIEKRLDSLQPSTLKQVLKDLDLAEAFPHRVPFAGIAVPSSKEARRVREKLLGHVPRNKYR